MDALPDAQLEIMQMIWSHNGEMMFSELWDVLSTREKSWKTNTVLTFLARLTERGMLRVTKQGRLNRYTALVTEPQYLEAQTKSFVDKVCGGDVKHLLTALLKQDYLTEDDCKELEEYWNGTNSK